MLIVTVESVFTLSRQYNNTNLSHYNQQSCRIASEQTKIENSCYNQQNLASMQHMHANKQCNKVSFYAHKK